MSRLGTGLQGAFLGLNAAYLLTLLLGVWLRGWPLNPYFAGVALLVIGAFADFEEEENVIVLTKVRQMRLKENASYSFFE